MIKTPLPAITFFVEYGAHQEIPPLNLVILGERTYVFIKKLKETFFSSRFFSPTFPKNKFQFHWGVWTSPMTQSFAHILG